MDLKSKTQTQLASHCKSSAYALPQQQLVLEIYCSSVKRSIEFYTSLGFELKWRVPDFEGNLDGDNFFAQISWGDGCLLFLKAKKKNETITSSGGVGNIRVMVPDVDVKYAQCQKLGYQIVLELGDRKFVVRDFIVADPDGFGLRFASYLPERGRKEQEGPDHALVIRSGMLSTA